MKKFYHFTLALAGGLLILGILLTVVGLVLGAPLSSLSIEGPLKIRIFPHLSAFSSQKVENADFSAAYEGVRSLEIEGAEAAITIESGDTFSIAVSNPAPDFSSQLNGSRWVIHSGSWGNHHRQTPDSEKITITLPADFMAEELKVELGVGSLTSTPLATRKAELEVALGELTLEKLDCSDLSLEVEMGTADITLAGREEDFALELENNMGSVTVGSRSWAALSQEERWNSGAPNKADLSCSMGEILLQWEE